MDREARIKLLVEGSSRAASDVRQVSGAMGGLGKAAKETESLSGKAMGALGTVAKAAYKAVADVSRAMNDVRPIAFAAAADQAKRFDEQVTRLAVRSNVGISTLKNQFRDVGKEIGVMPERVAAATSALTKMTGSDNAAAAMRALGDEANDTDRSLEDMTQFGATLYNKLGVPMDKVGESIRRIRMIASDFSMAGGHTALEDTLVRLGPLLARFQGGLSRASATVAALSKGKSQDVAEETTAGVMSTLEGLDPLLLTKKMREITGDRNYNPYTRDEQGRVVQKKEIPRLLQGHLRKLPRSASYALFGRSMQGIQAAEAFHELNFDEVDQTEKWIGERDAALQEGKRNLAGLGLGTDSRGLLKPGTTLGDLAAKIPTSYRDTVAGERGRTDVAREDVNLRAGEVVQQQRDARNRLFEGNRDAQAAIDTYKQYLPNSWQMPLDIAEAGAVGAVTYKNDKEAAQPVTVKLDPASTKSLADAIRSAPPIVRTGNGPAAQAVEDSKAKGRSAANF